MSRFSLRGSNPPDPAPPTVASLRQEISALSKVAQAAEQVGDSVRADSAHNELNNALDLLQTL